jgi:polyadenylate-binding protein
MNTASVLIFFRSTEAAMQAKKLQFEVVNKKEMLISYFDREKVKDRKGNLFVKGLPPNLTNKSLYDLFAQCGEIFSSKLPLNIDGTPKGYGYVQYMEHQTKDKLLENNSIITNTIPNLKISEYKERPRTTTYTNIYIKNLPSTITKEVINEQFNEVKGKEKLEELFVSFGKITSSKICTNIMLNGKNGEIKIGYFGFVNFENASSAEKAVQQMHNKVIEDSPLFVCRALNKEQREREKRQQFLDFKKKRRRCSIYIKDTNGRSLDEQVIRRKFAVYNIAGIYIIPRGCNGELINGSVGIVTFRTEKDASRVKTGRYGPLEVRRLESKEERRIRLSKLRHRMLYFV